MNSRYWRKTKKCHQNYLLSKERMLAGYHVVTQAMRGKGLMTRETSKNVRHVGSWTRKHARHVDPWALKHALHMST